MKKLNITYKDIISPENLLEAWKEFLKGKRKRLDVEEFQYRLSDNIVFIQKLLIDKTYCHSGYYAFNVSDPKPRNIHKATVRDRVIHRAIYRQLYPYFEKRFIFDSYSCRNFKGTHRALNRFRDFGRKVSKSGRKTCFVIKCDIRKFFASVDHSILLNILRKHIEDQDVLWLLKRVIESFDLGKIGVGLPLGNLTSQLLVNIYMNEFDQYVKHRLKEKYYIRYADDFVFLDTEKDRLLELIPKIGDWLEENLKLSLHPDKLFVKTLGSGVDFLGWVHFLHYRVIRTTTKKRMVRNLKLKEYKPETVQSYLGLLRHGNERRLALAISNQQKDSLVVLKRV